MFGDLRPLDLSLSAAGDGPRIPVALVMNTFTLTESTTNYQVIGHQTTKTKLFTHKKNNRQPF